MHGAITISAGIPINEPDFTMYILSYENTLTPSATKTLLSLGKLKPRLCGFCSLVKPSCLACEHQYNTFYGKEMLRAHGPVRMYLSEKQVSKQAWTRSWQLDVFIPLK